MKIFIYIAKILLTLFLLGLILKTINGEGMWKSILFANPSYIVLSAILIAVHVLVKSYKWYLLTKEIDGTNTFGSAVKSYLRGTSLAIVTPSRIGELGGDV